MKGILQLLLIFTVFHPQSYAQTNPKLIIEKKKMDKEVYDFLKRIESKHISSIMVSQNVTCYYKVTGSDKDCINTELNLPKEAISNYDNYSVSYQGPISSLTVVYSNIMGKTITSGTITKLGDHYVIAEISCGDANCETTVYKDGVKLFKREDQEK
jgi:aspartokinase